MRFSLNWNNPSKINAGRRVLGRTTGLGLGLGLLLAMAIPSVSSADSAMRTDFHAWNNGQLWSGSMTDGATIGLAGGHPAITLRAGATTGSWTSPAYSPHVPIAKLVSSWQADTPGGSWVETDLSVQVKGAWSGWYVMGKWAFNPTTLQRTSVPGQSDQNGSISQDTYYDNTTPATQYRLREVLYGANGAVPAVRQVAATASDPTVVNQTASATTMRQTIDLSVPSLSQYVHNGEYPQFDGGGEAWCSPTSVAMVLQYWGRGPSASQIATLPADPVFDANQRADGQVDYAAYHILTTAPTS